MGWEDECGLTGAGTALRGARAKFSQNTYNFAFLATVCILHTDPLRICPGGEIGRRRGLKIPRRKACRFDSGPGHQLKNQSLT